MGSPINVLGSLAAPSGTGIAAQPVAAGDNDLTRFIRSIEGLTAQQGQGILGAGLQTQQQGVTALGPALNLLTALTKGDQGDLSQAAQPEIDQINQQFDAIRNMVSLQPRGGGKASALAEAPFQKAASIQRTEGQMRSNAATSLAGVGTSLAGIGLSEAGLGQGLEQQASNMALSKAGLNIQGGTAATFGQIAGGISNLINAVF